MFALPPAKGVRADERAERVEHLGRLVVGDGVHHLVRIVHALAHDRPRHAGLLLGERAARAAQGRDLAAPHVVRAEDARKVGALHVHRVRLVQPHVEHGLHRHATAAVVVLVLVGDHAVGVDETPVGDRVVDERRLGDDRRVARVLHAAVERLLHADRAVHLERVLVAGQLVLEQHDSFRMRIGSRAPSRWPGGTRYSSFTFRCVSGYSTSSASTSHVPAHARNR